MKNLPLIESETDSVPAEAKANFKADKTSLFIFNPNTVSESELLRLGLSNKTAITFLKFRNKGFEFRKKEDLKKVYGISGALYEKLQAYIYIEPQQKVSEAKTIEPARRQIELNSADSMLLLEIKGVGPAFAKRIVKYRDLLGGFINKAQLKEIYGFTEEMYLNISPQIKVAGEVAKININTDDFKKVNRHPYLSYEITKQIFNVRRKQAVGEKELKEIIQDEALYEKIVPYINFN